MFQLTILSFFCVLVLYIHHGTGVDLNYEVKRLELFNSVLLRMVHADDSWFDLYIRKMWNATWENGNRVPKEITALVFFKRWSTMSGSIRNKSCAVVLNSGSLLRRKHGNEIDNHSAIWRINEAITSGYKEDLGSKTTHLISHTKYAHYHLHLDLSKVEWVNHPGKVKMYKPWVSASMLCSSMIGVNECTSGMLAVVMAKSVCASIDIYGTSTSACNRTHYFTDHDWLYFGGYLNSTEERDILCEHPVDYFRGANGHQFDREYKALKTIAAIDHSLQIIY
jgi:hypothetical protein